MDSDRDAHLFVGVFDGSTGNDQLYVDGDLLVDADAGSETLTGLSIGRHQNLTVHGLNGGLALIGIFEGDVTQAAGWDEFRTWASNHYGVTL